MEGVLGAPAVGDGVGQGLDDLVELRERARPAVGQDQRERVGLGRPPVHEVDVEAVDAGLELVEPVEPPLLGPPVELVAPVLDELPQVGLVHPELPPDALGLVGHAGAREPLLQVGQHVVGDVDGERLDGVAGGGLVRCGAGGRRPWAGSGHAGGQGQCQGDEQGGDCWSHIPPPERVCYATRSATTSAGARASSSAW